MSECAVRCPSASVLSALYHLRLTPAEKTMEDGDVVTFKAGLYAIALPGEEAAAANTEGYDDEEDDEHEDEEEKGEGEGDEQDGDGVAADDL